MFYTFIQYSRDAKESLELEEAQIRYEFEELKSTLLKELDVRDHEHSEKVKSMEKVHHLILVYIKLSLNISYCGVSLNDANSIYRQ